jgi:hypothetical protein
MIYSLFAPVASFARKKETTEKQRHGEKRIYPQMTQITQIALTRQDLQN